MKKNYNQPIVETERLEIIGQALCISPNGLPVNPAPIPNEGGGD